MSKPKHIAGVWKHGQVYTVQTSENIVLIAGKTYKILPNLYYEEGSKRPQFLMYEPERIFGKIEEEYEEEN